MPTFVSEFVSADVASERLLSRVLPVVVVNFGLRLEALAADVTDELAVARVQLLVPLEEGVLLKAAIAAWVLAPKGLGGPGREKGGGRHARERLGRGQP